MKKQNIEVEGGELLIQSKEGHYAIIPAKHRQEVMDMVKDGCDDCINAYIQTLPKDSDYAEDGSLYPEEPIINPNNPIQLKEVTITAEAPTYVKYKQEWEKENPFDLNKYIEDRFNNPVGREAIKRIDEKGWREQLKQEGLQKRQQELDEATKMGLLYQRFNPQDKDDISIADEQFQKRYGTSPHRYRYDNDPEYRKYYEQQARNATSKIDYPSTDLRRKDVVAPNNMWMYPNLTGESKKAMTDFSNEVIGMALPIPGLEAMGEIPSVFKAGKNLIKPASKAVSTTSNITGKGAQIAKNILNTASDTPTASIINKVDDVGKGLTQTPKPAWQMQEHPGLHLKSTLPDNPKGIHTNIRKSDGTIDTRTVLDQMKKVEGDAKYAEWVKGFKDMYGEGLENLPKRMDYNEFIKIGQKNLIELNHSLHPNLNETFMRNRLKGANLADKDLLDQQVVILSNKSKFCRGSSAHGNPEETLGHLQVVVTKENPDVLTTLGIQSDAFQGTHRIMPKVFDEIAEKRSLRFLEEQAINQGNLHKQAIKQKDGSWLYPDGTKVSDKIHNEFSLKTYNDLIAQKKAEIENFAQKQLLDKNHPERYLQELVDYAGKRGDVNKIRVPTPETAAKIQGYTKIQNPEYTYLLNRYKGFTKDKLNKIQAEKRRLILDTKNKIDEIEFGLNPDNSKVVSENSYWSGFRTEEGIKSYEKDLRILKHDLERLNIELQDLPDAFVKQKKYAKKELDEFFTAGKEKEIYSSEHQTILKKYSEQPKTIKKLFGIEPKIVTDSKGNTWYEFDIPKKFKEGKGEIKAFGLIPPAIGVGTAIQSQQNKTK